MRFFLGSVSPATNDYLKLVDNDLSRSPDSFSGLPTTRDMAPNLLFLIFLVDRLSIGGACSVLCSYSNVLSIYYSFDDGFSPAAENCLDVILLLPLFADAFLSFVRMRAFAPLISACLRRPGCS